METPMGRSQKKKKNLAKLLCRSMKNFLKSSQANDASLIFTLTINSSAGFVYFEETFHFFFPRHEV
jgi:hypothetical protein